MPGIMADMDQKDTYAVGWFLSTAPCIWQSLVLFGSCLRSTVRGLFWERTSGGIPHFSASWFDSGYIFASLRVFESSLRVQRNAWSSVVHAMRQLRSLRRRFLCRGAEVDSHGLAVQQTIEIPQLQLLDKVIDDPVVRVVLFFSCRSHARCVQRQVLGYVSLLQFINKVVHTPVVPQRQIPLVLPVRKTMETPQLQYVLVVDAPVVQVVLAMPVVVHDRRAWFRLCRHPWRCRSRSSFPVVDVAVFLERQVVS